jgi:outer membrane immunogenic protein
MLAQFHSGGSFQLRRGLLFRCAISDTPPRIQPGRDFLAWHQITGASNLIGRRTDFTDSRDGLVKKLIVASIAVAAFLSTPVLAAPPAPFNWSGFYAGADGGYAWSRTTDSFTSPFAPGAVITSVNPNPSGLFGRLQAGYNYEINTIVLGIVTDISSRIDGKVTSVTSPNSHFTQADQRLDFLGTVRGRVGFTPDNRWLVYGTGGFAYAHGKLETDILTVGCGGSICSLGSGSKMLTGWTAGAGAEYAMLNNWSFQVEYLFYDLGKISHVSTEIVGGVTDFAPSADFRGNLVTAGFNYKFGSR